MRAERGTAPRWRLRSRAELDVQQRALHDRIVAGPRGAKDQRVPLLGAGDDLLGPFALMTISPAPGDAVQELGAALRFRTGLSDVMRETGILLIAAHRDCRFEWVAHAPSASEAGVNDEQLEALRLGMVPDGLGRSETAALNAVRTMLLEGALSDAEYADAVRILGERTLVELVWLVGHYSMLALALAVFRPPPHEPANGVES